MEVRERVERIKNKPGAALGCFLWIWMTLVWVFAIAYIWRVELWQEWSEADFFISLLIWFGVFVIIQGIAWLPPIFLLTRLRI